MSETNTTTAQRIRAIPLFSELPDEAVSKVATMAKEFQFPKGHVLIQAHQPGSGLYVIEDGKVSIHLKEKKWERGSGECVGELSLLTDHPRAARVQAITDVNGFAINRNDFREVLESEPQLALKLLEVLAARLSDQIL